MSNHTWIPIHREAAAKLLTFKDRQGELIDLLRSMEHAGLKVISLKDQNPKQNEIPLAEIDPFTFFASFNRGITHENRRANWLFLKNSWKLDAAVPDDFAGIPIANNQKSWWFPYAYLRSPEHVGLLWQIAEMAYRRKPDELSSELFEQCLELRGIAWAYLTMGLFWMNPNEYLSFDSVNNDYLVHLGLDDDVNDYGDYLAYLKKFREKIHMSIPEFSYKAWKWSWEDGEGDDEEDDKPVVSPDARRWVIAPGEQAKYWPDCLAEGNITIGWDEVGDITGFKSREALQLAIAAKIGGESGHTNSSLALWEFRQSIRPGDVIYAKQGMTRVLGWGIVTSEYRFDSSRNTHRNVIDVEWKDTREVTLPEQCRVPLKTLTNVDGHARFLEFVKSFYGDGQPILPKPVEVGLVSPYTREMALEDLFLSEDKFDQILALLKRKKNLILQGPPGVGKTFVARRLAYALMKEKDELRAPMVQFHQSYAYEDFIQGYRPDGKGGFVLKSGTFHTLCKQAAIDKDRDYFLVIDEINRGNLSKIFGELMMLMEADKRGPDYSLQLTYSETADDTFYIPDNLHLIGTMNTADRSLALVDYALRRRVAFITLAPEFGSDKFRQVLKTRGAEGGLIDKIIAGMGALNKTIHTDSRNLGWGYCIGHSFFCPGKDVTLDEAWYQEVIEYEIAPLLREYWVDDESRCEEELEKLKS
jgi:5-methylcytosine-specific restriction enzyme B